jgi:hypothetical protein
MSRLHSIIPYQSIREDEKVYAFGMTREQVAALDSKIFEVKEDNSSKWVLERRGGYSTIFVDGTLAEVAFRIDPSHNRFEVDGIDISDADGVEQLKQKHEYHVFANSESVLFWEPFYGRGRPRRKRAQR